MAELSIKIDSKKFDALLKNAPQKVKKAIDKSLRQSALVVQNQAKGNAPFLTGNLRRSITNVIKKGVARVGTNVIYAAYQEFKNKRRPRGYLRPALKDNKGKIKAIFTKNINRIFK